MAAKKKRKAPKKSPEDVLAGVFVKRTGKIFDNHRRNAREAGAWLDYDLEGFRKLVRKALDSGDCPYCWGPLTERNFSPDHKVPTSRAGGHSVANLAICCLDCNLAKGPLDHVEWRQLVQVLASWSAPARRHTLARLRAGGARIRSGIRPPTASDAVTPGYHTGRGVEDAPGGDST